MTGPAPKVRQRCCPRSIADISPLTRPAVNPAVATGLLHPILLWQQDCSTQSCCGNRIAPPNPAVATGLPRCFPENAGSAVLYSTTPPDSPPGLRGKLRQRVGTHRCADGLAARIARKTPAVRRYTPMHSRTRRPDCAENSVSASVHTDALTDSPPGLRGKHRQCVGTHRCTPGLAARIARKTPPASCCVAGR